MYLNVEIYNVEQRRISIVYFNVNIDNVRQRRNNVVIFNLEFYNVDQLRSNVLNMAICKKLINKPRVKSNNLFLSFKEKPFKTESTELNVSTTDLVDFIPRFKINMKKNICKVAKILKSRKRFITRTKFKPFRFVKCHLAFN